MRKLMSLVAFVVVFLLVFSSALADTPLFAFDSPTYTVLKGKTVKINIVRQNISGTMTFVWTSSDESIATVNSGTVKGVGAGEATIRCDATSKDGTTYTAECTVEVLQPVEQITPADKKFVIPNVKTSVKVGIANSQEQVDFYRDTLGWIWPIVIVGPENAGNTELSFTSSNRSVILASDACIMPLKAGTATITAKATDGSGKQCRFTVTIPELYTSTEKIEISMDEEAELIYQINGNGIYAVNTSGTCFDYEEVDGLYDDLTYWRIKPKEVGEGWILFTKNGKKLGAVEVAVVASEQDHQDADGVSGDGTAPTMDQIKSIVESSLADLADYYAVEADDTGMIITVAFDGMAREVSDAKAAGSKWDSTTWDTMRKNMLDMYNAIYSMLESTGISEPTLMFSLVNDQNHDNVFLGIAYGIVIYDVMAE